jgi:hypothetical protein
MVSIFMWIVCVYAVVAAAALWLVKRHAGRRPGRHYILLADDQAPRVEWYLRALRGFAVRSGTEVSVTVVDGESTEETAAIADRLAREGVPVQVTAVGQHTWERLRTWSADGAHGENDSEVWRFLQEQGVIMDDRQTVLVDVRDPEEAARLRW